jgi:hypothetical protein
MSRRLARGLRVLGLTTCLVAALAPAASAIETKRDRVGDVRAKGLSPSERRALDIVSVTTLGGPEFGLIVTVTFRGNLERRIGRGGLRQALVALVLEPNSRRQRLAGIISDRRGHFGRTRRRTRSNAVYVRRDGRRFTFLLLGPGLQNVRRIAVGAFAKPPRTGSRKVARASQNLTDGFLALIVRSMLDDDDTADSMLQRAKDLDISRKDCPTLRRDLARTEVEEAALTAEIERAEDARRRLAVERLARLRDRVRKHSRLLRDEIARRCGAAPPQGGPERTCEFGFSKNSPDDFLMSWRCDQLHGNVSFSFNADIASIDQTVGNAKQSCRIDNPRLIECDGTFDGGQTYVFAIETAAAADCPAFHFDPTVDGRALPQVACSG